MKKQILFLGVILFGLFGIISCETEGDLPVAKDLKLNRTELSIMQGREGEVTIVSGNGDYEFTSSDEEVATASVSSNVIKVKALKVGETEIEVVDGRKKHATFKVIVTEKPALTLAEEMVTIVNGKTATVEITSGTPEYTAKSSDDTKATAEIKDGKLVITAKANEGVVTITVIDSNNKTVTIDVTLAPVLTFDDTETKTLKFILGDIEANRTVTIEGGTAPYTIIQEDFMRYSDPKSRVENVTLDKVVELDNGYGTKFPCKAGEFSGNTIVFNADKSISGENYIIRDANGKESKIRVKVEKPLVVSKEEISVFVGETINKKSKIQVKGYIEKIKIKSNSNPDVVDASIEQSNNTYSRALILTGKAVGTATLVITDGVVDKTVTVKVQKVQELVVYEKDGVTEVSATKVYTEADEFVIKGGLPDGYKVTYTLNGQDTKILSETIYQGGLNLKRNKGFRDGGTVTVKVARTDKPTSYKEFKVECPNLVTAVFKLNGQVIPQKDEIDPSATEPYLFVSKADNWSSGNHQLYNIKAGQTIDVELKNADASKSYTLEKKWNGTGANQKIETVETATNHTFKIKELRDGMGDLYVKDGAEKVLYIEFKN